MDFIGHLSARRILTPDGWLYQDADNQSLAVDFGIAYGVNLAALDGAIEQLEAENSCVGDELRKRRTQALSAYKIHDRDAAKAHVEFINLAKRFIQRDDYLLPLARTGKKFTDGRKPLTGGPIRKAIARLLKKTPTMKNPELWDEVSKKSPRGWTAYDNPQGKYIEGPLANDNMSQRRFFNVCGEERKKLK